MHELDTQLISVVTAVIVVWGFMSARLERLDVSPALAMMVAGLVLANPPFSLVDVSARSGSLRLLAEITLALLLFSDAARVNLRGLRKDSDVPSRLLLIGLPLTIALGTGFAGVLFAGIDPWVAAALAAAVAPTDAALGAQLIEDPQVPLRVRRFLNVESGLNDGIATPFVVFFLAGAVGDLVAHPSIGVLGGLGDIALGVLVGIALGAGGGAVLAWGSRQGWADHSYRGITVAGLALLAYSLTIEAGGNGFVAAFVGGLAFGTVMSPHQAPDVIEFDAETGSLLSLVVWFLFGAVIVKALDGTTWQVVAFAVLSLTVSRMLPVFVALLGTHLNRVTVSFIGWFGPRGLASIVFGILGYDALTGTQASLLLRTVTLTVVLSVVAHGISARPLSRIYGEYATTKLSADPPESVSVPTLASRHRPGFRARFHKHS